MREEGQCEGRDSVREGEVQCDRRDSVREGGGTVGGEEEEQT